MHNSVNPKFEETVIQCYCNTVPIFRFNNAYKPLDRWLEYFKGDHINTFKAVVRLDVHSDINHIDNFLELAMLEPNFKNIKIIEIKGNGCLGLTTTKKIFEMVNLTHITLNGFMKVSDLRNILDNNMKTLQELNIGTHTSLDICRGNSCEEILKLVTKLSCNCRVRISVQGNLEETFKQSNIRISELAQKYNCQLENNIPIDIILYTKNVIQ
jgi:hypothetical protein